MERVLVCGVCGGTGAGKSTLVSEVLDRWDRGSVAVVGFDAYYHSFGHLPVEARARVNYDHPDSLDVALFVEHLDLLRIGGAVDAPVYDFATHTRSATTERVEARPLVLVDGILLLAFDEVRARLDHTVFLDVDPQLRFTRRLGRDLVERGRTEEGVRTQWVTTVQPMHRQYVQPSVRHADVVVDRFDDETRAVVADEVVAGLRAMLTPAVSA